MTVRIRTRSKNAALPTGSDDETINPSSMLGLLAAFVAVWTVYLTVTEAPGAIKHDMAEAYAWGQEFQLGYNQHPPFWAWICGAWFSVFPRSGWAFALLSSLNASIGLWGAWMLIGDFADGRRRMCAWILLLLTPIYTFYAYKYDANTIFLSIWPWTLHYLMRSVRGREIGDAVGLGVCAGLAMMSKYYAAILVATCLLAVLQHPARRKYLTSASPWVSTVIAAMVFAPHVAWLMTHRAPPLRYLANVSGQRWDDVLDAAANTLVGAINMNVGVLAVLGLSAWLSRRGATAASSPDMRRPPLRILATLALAPLVLTIASGLMLRIRSTPEMMIGTLPLFPLLAIELSRVRDTGKLYWIACRLAGAVTLGALVLSPAIAAARTWLSPAAIKVAPYQEAAAEATRIWHSRTSVPLSYVGGSDWYENAIAFYSVDRPHVFVHFNFDRNLWVTRERLAKHGLLSMCISADSVCLAETEAFVTPETTRTEVSLAHVFWGHVARPVHFVVTVIPPRG